MPLDPECRRFLDEMARLRPRPFETEKASEARAQRASTAQAVTEMSGPAQEVAQIENRAIHAGGHEIPIRIYWPSHSVDLPVLVYFHGGGWVFGNLDSVDRPCRALANAAHSIVLSVDYRLAPEQKFPAAFEDACTAVDYAFCAAKEIGGDAGRIAVGGDSAGGNLATAAALWVKRRGGQRLRLQLLIYPMVDYSDDRPSLREFESGYLLSRAGIEWFWQHYLNSPEDGRNPYASPMLAEDVEDVAPAFVLTAECDPLRDQGEAYARKLEEAGVRVNLKRYEGAVHAFFPAAGMLASAKEALEECAAALRQAFEPAGATATRR
jgi:acetyl esterase